MLRNREVLNAEEAARLLGAHVETVRRLARKDLIPAYKMGKDWRFRREALVRWAEDHHLRGRRPTVLVVDDEEGIRKLMRQLLTAEGYRALLASNGAQGLACVTRESVNLVLLDMNMPGMNGADFLCELRKTDVALPVIVVTGYPDGDLMAKAIHHGPLMLLAKPVEKEPLLIAVRTALKGSLAAATV